MREPTPDPRGLVGAGSTAGLHDRHAARYLNRSALDTALVPPAMVTLTLTVPLPVGLLAVILVGLTTTMRVAALAPNRTLAPRTKSAPMMVTTVPPRRGPSRGETEVTRGAR